MVIWPPCHMVNSTSDAIWERVKSCTMVIEFTKNVENIRYLIPSTQLEKTPLRVLNILKKETSTVHEIHKKHHVCNKKERKARGGASLDDDNCLWIFAQFLGQSCTDSHGSKKILISYHL
jgi:hypothetical protein